MRFQRLVGSTDSHPTSGVTEALGDPTRWEIVELLAAGPLTVNEVAGHFATARTTVSRHLTALRSSGVVTATKHGQQSVHELDRALLRSLAAVLNALADGPTSIALAPAAAALLEAGGRLGTTGPEGVLAAAAATAGVDATLVEAAEARALAAAELDHAHDRPDERATALRDEAFRTARGRGSNVAGVSDVVDAALLLAADVDPSLAAALAPLLDPDDHERQPVPTAGDDALAIVAAIDDLVGRLRTTLTDP